MRVNGRKVPGVSVGSVFSTHHSTSCKTGAQGNLPSLYALVQIDKYEYNTHVVAVQTGGASTILFRLTFDVPPSSDDFINTGNPLYSHFSTLKIT